MCKLSSIEKICGGSIGGIVEVLLINPADILMLPNPGCDISYTGEVLLKPGAQKYLIKVERNSALFRERSNRSNKNGDFFEQEFTFSTLKDRDSVARLVQRLINRRVHIEFKYAEGTRKLLLNARSVSDHDSGQRRRDRVSTKFTFNATNTKRALILKSLAPGNTNPYSDGFSSGFGNNDSVLSFAFSTGYLSTSFA